MTYHPETYYILKSFFDSLKNDQTEKDVPDILREYLKSINFFERLKETRMRSQSQSAFIKNIFYWLDGFFVLKMVHYLRDNHFGEMELSKAVQTLVVEMGFHINEVQNPEDLLKLLREIEYEL